MAIITKCPYRCGPDILYHPDCTTAEVVLDYGNAFHILAGAPISAKGAVADDASAIGVLLHDAYKGYHQRSKVVISGFVRADIIEDHAGATPSDAAKSAMPNVVFIDGAGKVQASAGGGGGGGVVFIPFQWTGTRPKNEDGSRGTLTLMNPNITVDMIIQALQEGHNVIAQVVCNGNMLYAPFAGFDDFDGICFVQHYMPSSSSDVQAARVFTLANSGACAAYDNGVMG